MFWRLFFEFCSKFEPGILLPDVSPGPKVLHCLQIQKNSEQTFR